jgi:transcriptional regulator with PAS, ATPase and Fis domain
MTRRILVTWVGSTDLGAWSRNATLSASHQEMVKKVLKGKKPPEGIGPIKALLDKETFTQVHLIGDYDRSLLLQFSKWLNTPSSIHCVDVEEKPTNHAKIYQIVDPIIESLKISTGDELCFHLSPGTPSMHSIFVLLGKSKYPATLFQTHFDESTKINHVQKAEIPFDITVDVLPQFMREPDRLMQHLMSHSPQETQGFESIIGDSETIRLAVGRAQRAAIHDVSVLILGESGTGKEMFAEAIHKASGRRNKTMLSINCAAISNELIESELFGHSKGAFTGADKERIGLLKQADGGTLFLDEVGECDLSLQAKLLRALQPAHDKGPCHRVFRPVQGNQDQEADVRIIAATNRDLVKMVQQGTFREDLLYRLATITVKLPPLRERGKDVMTLAENMLVGINNQFQTALGKAYVPKTLSADAKKFVRKHEWPGNVRELRNVLIQSAVMSIAKTITERDIAAALSQLPNMRLDSGETDKPLGDGFDLDAYLEEIRKRYLTRAMHQTNGVKNKAAELLGYNSHQVLTSHLIRSGLEAKKKKASRRTQS